MLELELGEQLALARGRMVGDLPAEMRGVAPALEELMDELAAQSRALAFTLIPGGADEDDLVAVPQLEHPGRVWRNRDESREHEPLRAPDRHARSMHRMPCVTLSVFLQPP